MSQCILCLDNVPDSYKPKELGCACQLSFHTKCWTQYVLEKGYVECPLCKTYFVMNPLHMVTVPPKDKKMWAYPLGICALLFLVNLVIIGIILEKR